MSRTSASRGAGIADRQVDVVVIGAGLSGVLASEHIARNGLSCLILEAGPVLERRLPSCDARHYKEVSAPLLEIDPAGWAYRTEGQPADWVRVRAGGGRSLVWGGWLLRPSPQSWRDAAAFGRPWPFTLQDLQTHMRRAAHMLGARDAELLPHFEAAGAALGLKVEAKRVAPGPCGCRAFVAMDILKAARLRPMSVVTRVLIDGNGRAEGVAFTDAHSGEKGVVRAKAVVLSASPVETTRLLLDCLHDRDLGARAHVGQSLVDHFVSGCLVLVPERATDDPPTPFRRAAFVPRFVNMGRARRRDYRGGFSVELHGPDPLAELDAETIRALGVPPEDAGRFSFCTVHAIGETAPHPDRFVSLHPADRDAFGRPMPVLHVARGGNERLMARDMDETVRAIADALATPGCVVHPIRETLGRVEFSHEAGTCRIGKSERTSVVNLSGQVHGVPGLYVADASLLPTALDRPHTLAVLGLALNTADGVLAAAGVTSRTT